MAFNAPSNLIVLSDLPNSWELDISTVDAVDAGWDTLKARFLRDYGSVSKTGPEVARDFADLGDKMPGHTSEDFWVVGKTPTRLGANIWSIDATALGLCAERPYKVTMGSSTEQQSGENVNLGPDYGGVRNKVQVLESTVTLNIDYIQIGGLPPTELVGMEGSPAVTFAVRDSVWTSLTDPTVHFPAGWVFMGFELEQLLDLDVWLIREVWQYVHMYSP